MGASTAEQRATIASAAPAARPRLRSVYADDEAMQPILTDYVAALPGHVATLLRLLAADDVDGVRRVAHQLKGSGGGYGFPDLTAAAAAAESAAQSGGPIGSITTAVGNLVALVRAVEGYEPPRERAGPREGNGVA